jgi:hypothetical protein
MAASGYNMPIPFAGISTTQMSAIGMVSWLFGSEHHSARNSLFAWIPADLAKDKPIDYLADLLFDAASKAAKDLGFRPKQNIAKGGTDKSGSSVSLLDGEVTECKTIDNDSTCWLAFGLRDPKKL